MPWSAARRRPDGDVEGHERRQAERRRTDGMVYCWVPNPTGEGGVALLARVVDLSQTGARISIDQEVAFGAVLDLEFLTPAGERGGFAMPAVARWCRSSAPGEWQVGCQFMQTVTLAKLVELLR